MSINGYLAERSEVASNGCILWRGSKTRGGYGTANIGGRKTTAHRIAFEATKGPIADGLEIDHLCGDPLCINPAHLEAVSHAENVRRSRTARATHCVSGHEFTPANTYRKKSNGCRVCRACAARRSAENRRRAKEVRT